MLELDRRFVAYTRAVILSAVSAIYYDKNRDVAIWSLIGAQLR